MPEDTTLLADVDMTNFEIGSAMIAYGETKLGATADPPKISVEPVTREVRCNQAGQNPLAVYIIGYNIKIKAKFMEVSKILEALFPNQKLSSDDFGKNLLAEGTGKAITVVGTKRSFMAPKAVAISPWEYGLDGNEEHGIEVEFTCYQGADGTYLQHITAGA